MPVRQALGLVAQESPLLPPGLHRGRRCRRAAGGSSPGGAWGPAGAAPDGTRRAGPPGVCAAGAWGASGMTLKTRLCIMMNI